MNFVKRGLRSLLYHWKNTAALVVIYFLSSALVLVGLNIRQACLATAEEAGEKIGADRKPERTRLHCRRVKREGPASAGLFLSSVKKDMF